MIYGNIALKFNSHKNKNPGRIIKEIVSSELESEIIKMLRIDTNNNKRGQQVLQQKNYNATVVNGLIEVREKRAINRSEDMASLLV